MAIIGFFPTPVWVTQLADDEAAEINRQAIELVESFRGHLPGVGPMDPWQTPNDLQDRPELAGLMAKARDTVGDALDDLNIVHDGFMFTGCWASIKPKGTGHGMHMHPNNFFGGVYYVRASGEGGDIHFHDPRPQTTVTRPRVTEENEYNARTIRLPVREGMMILFPGWLSHSVGRNKSETERISVSFNVQFQRYAEVIAPPRW